MTKAKLLGLLSAVMAVTLFTCSSASAVPVPVPAIGARLGSNTEMTFTNTGPGQGVTGFIADAANSFDPVSGYPANNPGAGFTPKDEGFAGIIVGTPTGGGTPMQMYCIDILTNTSPGTGYELGSWSEANVARVGYIAQLLNSYYPTVPAQPAGLANTSQQAAAVQAAIWFFSDRYVLNTSDPLHNTVAAITAAVIAAGPLVQPPAPSLTITPAVQGGSVGSAVGPFVVTSTAATTVAATGGTMFSDAAGTVPIPNGTPVASGINIWLRAPGSDPAVLEATAQASVPTGNVYLYDGNTPGTVHAQRLILAQTTTLTTTVDAQAIFKRPGQLVVNKTIGGPAAGQQGQIVIVVTCDGTPLQPPFVIPAGTPAGTLSQTYSPIAADSVCTVVEDTDGHTPTITARQQGSGIVVTIPEAGIATADLTDVYDVGSLVVNKTITGAAAGQQGGVVISVTCGQTPLADFVIPAGTPSGTVSQTYANIPAGTVCTATETASGASATVTVTSEGSPQSLTIAANGSGTINITNTYDLITGSLVVNKTFSGSGAGQQSPVGILVSCGLPNIAAFVIPAGTPSGAFPRSFDGIPAGTTCTVAEVLDGSTSAVDVTVTGGRQQVVIPGGGVATVDLVNLVESLAPVPPTPTTPATLPRTGRAEDLGSVAVTALLLSATGIVMLFATRRRRRAV